MIGASGHCGSPCPLDGDVDEHRASTSSSSSSSSDSEGWATVAAGVRPSPTKAEDDVDWSNIDATSRLSAGVSSSSPGQPCTVLPISPPVSLIPLPQCSLF